MTAKDCPDCQILMIKMHGCAEKLVAVCSDKTLSLGDREKSINDLTDRYWSMLKQLAVRSNVRTFEELQSLFKTNNASRPSISIDPRSLSDANVLRC